MCQPPKSGETTPLPPNTSRILSQYHHSNLGLCNQQPKPPVRLIDSFDLLEQLWPPLTARGMGWPTVPKIVSPVRSNSPCSVVPTVSSTWPEQAYGGKAASPEWSNSFRAAAAALQSLA
uniref:Uncharacterized protein n=1 Tax=Sphaerodactylus townsendi TaxID=933632 RepID=A0ACB8EFL6_9SAUR